LTIIISMIHNGMEIIMTLTHTDGTVDNISMTLTHRQYIDNITMIHV